MEAVKTQDDDCGFLFASIFGQSLFVLYFIIIYGPRLNYFSYIAHPWVRRDLLI